MEHAGARGGGGAQGDETADGEFPPSCHVLWEAVSVPRRRLRPLFTERVGGGEIHVDSGGRLSRLILWLRQLLRARVQRWG